MNGLPEEPQLLWKYLAIVTGGLILIAVFIYMVCKKKCCWQTKDAPLDYNQLNADPTDYMPPTQGEIDYNDHALI
jgi:hypothetical protein